MGYKRDLEKMLATESANTPLLDFLIRHTATEVESVDGNDRERIFRKVGVPGKFLEVAETVNEQTVEVFTLSAYDRNDALCLNGGEIVVFPDVDGYNDAGDARRPGCPLVCEVAEGTEPVQTSFTKVLKLRAINGRKSTQDSYPCTPKIPAGTRMVLMDYVYSDNVDVYDPYGAQWNAENEKYKFAVGRFRGPLDCKPYHSPVTRKEKQAIRQHLLGKECALLFNMGNSGRGLSRGVREQASFEFELENAWAPAEEWFAALYSLFFSGANAPKSSVMFAGTRLFRNISGYLQDCRFTETFVNMRGNSVLRYRGGMGRLDIISCPAFDMMDYDNDGVILNPDETYYWIEDINSDAVLLGDNNSVWINGSGRGSMSNRSKLKVRKNFDENELEDGAFYVFLNDFEWGKLDYDSKRYEAYQAIMEVGADGSDDMRLKGFSLNELKSYGIYYRIW